jgi:phage pi2 protein 07
MNIYHAALALLLFPLHGQEAPNRFKKIPVLPKNPNELPVVVVNHIEHFLVDKERLHHWKSSHSDQKVTRDLVSSWIEQEQASIADSFFFTTRLEQNLSLQTGQLLTYPVEYTLPKFPGDWNIPSAFDQKFLGCNIDTIFSYDDQVQLQARLIFGEAQFLGSDPHSTIIEETQSPEDLFMPLFNTYQQNCKMPYTEGAHHLVGILNSLDDETKALLIFSTAESVTLDSIPKNKRVIDSSKPITVSCELIELSSESWIDFSRDKRPDQLRTNAATWTTVLLQEQKATRLKTLSKEVSWGEKHDLNPNAKLSTYVDSYKPTDPSKRLSPSNPLIPTEVMSGLKDFVINVTPDFTPSGHILFSYLWQLNSPREKHVIHRVSDGEQWIPDAWAPCLSFFNLEGALFLNPGEKTLVGALPVKDDETNPSPAKIRLFFLKAE